MGEAIGDTLPLAIGVALSPVPIIAIVLMLGTPRARSNGPAFALGWIAGLTVVGGVVLALASDNAQADDGSPEDGWITRSHRSWRGQAFACWLVGSCVGVRW